MNDDPGFVPVVIVGAGPTGITAATKLAQYGVDCLVLDRWADVYPQPRAVHLDDEIYRLLAGLGIAEEFAAISRPARGLQLRDRDMRVMAQFHRECAESANGFSQANMFDQPELEALLRANLKRYPHAVLRGNAEVTGVVQIGADRAQVAFTDRVSGEEHRVETRYVLGCDGANSLVRAAIGACMEDSEVSAALAGGRCGDGRRAEPAGGRPPRSAIRIERPPTCGSAIPATDGSSGCCRTRRPTTTAPWRRSTR